MSFKFTKNNLNFDVYTSPAKPTTPGANNDIAIITSVPMPNWVMSPDKPSGTPRSDGDVWIQYSVDGNTFNALKNNSMMIATISAWQYVDEAWVEVEAVSCQGGEWVDWVHYLYSKGTLQNELSNGFVKLHSGVTIIYNDNNIQYAFTPPSDYFDPSGIASADKIDVTGKRLFVKARVTFETVAHAKYYAGLCTTKSYSNLATSIAIPISTTGAVDFEIPVPADGGSYYLIFTCGGCEIPNCVEIEEIVLE